MPRVGSFSRMIRGRRISHLAITTFCWLPPDSAPTGMSSPAVLIASRRDHLVDQPFLGGAVDDAGAGHPVERGERQVLAHRHRQHQPLGLAVLGDQRHADPRPTAPPPGCRSTPACRRPGSRPAARAARRRRPAAARAGPGRRVRRGRPPRPDAGERDVVQPVAPGQSLRLQQAAARPAATPGRAGKTCEYSRPIIISTTSSSVRVPWS